MLKLNTALKARKNSVYSVTAHVLSAILSVPTLHQRLNDRRSDLLVFISVRKYSCLRMPSYRKREGYIFQQIVQLHLTLIKKSNSTELSSLFFIIAAVPDIYPNYPPPPCRDATKGHFLMCGFLSAYARAKITLQTPHAQRRLAVYFFQKTRLYLEAQTRLTFSPPESRNQGNRTRCLRPLYFFSDRDLKI